MKFLKKLPKFITAIAQYSQGLKDLNGIYFSTTATNCETNWSHFPIRVKNLYLMQRDLPSSKNSKFSNKLQTSREITYLPQRACLKINSKII